LAGFPVFIKHEADGLYHVQVGAFLHQSNAEAEKAKLVAAGYTTAFIKYE
jgi:cell division protein FtsN